MRINSEDIRKVKSTSVQEVYYEMVMAHVLYEIINNYKISSIPVLMKVVMIIPSTITYRNELLGVRKC